MIGPGYWATGITVTCHGEGRWSASTDYYDNGFCNDDPAAGIISTEGTLRTRYQVKPQRDADVLTVVIDALKADAERIGIRWRATDDSPPPSLYYRGDGEDPDYPPPDGWRELISKHADRLGWNRVYGEVSAGN